MDHQIHNLVRETTALWSRSAPLHCIIVAHVKTIPSPCSWDLGFRLDEWWFRLKICSTTFLNAEKHCKVHRMNTEKSWMSLLGMPYTIRELHFPAKKYLPTIVSLANASKIDLIASAGRLALPLPMLTPQQVLQSWKPLVASIPKLSEKSWCISNSQTRSLVSKSRVISLLQIITPKKQSRWFS